MKDETYVFISDVKEKGSIGRSAKARRTHTGKGGRVRLPSDNLSKKELMKMSGECKSYRLNDPMTWKEFMSMPDDIKVAYIKLLRQKFNAPGKYISQMLGINNGYYSKEINRLGISEGKNCRGRCTPWDKEGFWAWANGVDKLPTPVPEEPVEEPAQEEPEVFVEDDLPFEEQNCISTFVPVEHCMELDAFNTALKAQIDELEKRVIELIGRNEELMANYENDRQVIEKLRLMCSEYEEKARILEAQMDVVRMIFGGKNNG